MNDLNKIQINPKGKIDAKLETIAYLYGEDLDDKGTYNKSFLPVHQIL